VHVRALREDEVDLLRDVRLRALADSPWAFGSTYAREREHTPERWAWFAAQNDSVIYVALDGESGVGMAGGFVPEEPPDTVQVWGMWVAPEARGHGIARTLLESVLGWARERGAASVRLVVTDHELAAPAAELYRGLGFAPTGEREPLDGERDLETIVMSRAP
jgi:ribosomal protein S18 acetylase RimI-like enzyme